jgi:hypothetical protein
VTIPLGSPRFLNYWRLIDTLPDAAGTLSISIDGTVVSSLDLSTAAPDGDFVQQSIDIGAYADGAAHSIEIDYAYGDTAGTGADGVVFIDDVTIDSVGARPATPAHRQLGDLHKRRH